MWIRLRRKRHDSDRRVEVHRQGRLSTAGQYAGKPEPPATAGSEGWQFTIQPQRLRIPGPRPITIRVTEVNARTRRARLPQRQLRRDPHHPERPGHRVAPSSIPVNGGECTMEHSFYIPAAHASAIFGPQPPARPVHGQSARAWARLPRRAPRQGLAAPQQRPTSRRPHPLSHRRDPTTRSAGARWRASAPAQARCHFFTPGEPRSSSRTASSRTSAAVETRSTRIHPTYFVRNYQRIRSQPHGDVTTPGGRTTFRARHADKTAPGPARRSPAGDDRLEHQECPPAADAYARLRRR